MPPPENTAGINDAMIDTGYHLLRRIGAGSYGEVWLARDRAGSLCACKLVHRSSFEHDRPYEREYAGIQRFEPISRTSTNQIRILQVGRRDEHGFFYYCMELADSANDPFTADTYEPMSLRKRLQQHGRLKVKETVQIGKELAAALEHLHDHGLIHRDVKPSNVIFVKGEPKLADIGLLASSEGTISYVGTEGFIPPEGPTSALADIYALGKVLYEMCAGKDRLDYPELPEDFENLADREVLLELNAVIGRACETDPRKRYQSAGEMAAELALLSRGQSVRKSRQTFQRKLLIFRMVLVAVVFGLLTTGFAFLRFKPTPAEAAAPEIIQPPVSHPKALSPPIINPHNGHTYILLTNAIWIESEAIANSLGGHLATIRSQAEQEWVFTTFSRYAGVNRMLWIGLNDAANEGTFVWTSGEPVVYSNWAVGEPNNGKAGEHYVSMYDPRNAQAGKWNDWANRTTGPFGRPLNGVVEIIPKRKSVLGTPNKK
ncbi:MAG: protein kinase domain-containing protein [Limisphaerales bacterium]